MPICIVGKGNPTITSVDKGNLCRREGKLFGKETRLGRKESKLCPKEGKPLASKPEIAKRSANISAREQNLPERSQTLAKERQNFREGNPTLPERSQTFPQRIQTPPINVSSYSYRHTIHHSLFTSSPLHLFTLCSSPCFFRKSMISFTSSSSKLTKIFHLARGTRTNSPSVSKHSATSFAFVRRSSRNFRMSFERNGFFIYAIKNELI